MAQAHEEHRSPCEIEVTGSYRQEVGLLWAMPLEPRGHPLDYQARQYPEYIVYSNAVRGWKTPTFGMSKNDPQHIGRRRTSIQKQSTMKDDEMKGGT